MEEKRLTELKHASLRIWNLQNDARYRLLELIQEQDPNNRLGGGKEADRYVEEGYKMKIQ